MDFLKRAEGEHYHEHIFCIGRRPRQQAIPKNDGTGALKLQDVRDFLAAK
jgi:hypothetical protein